MKKILIAAAILLSGLSLEAQLPEVNSMQRVALPEGTIVMQPTISPDGSFVIVSDAAHDGLTKITLDGKASTVCTNGSGADIRISSDGTQVVFRRSVTGADHLRRNALVSVDLTSGAETQLVAPTRRLNAGISLNGNTVAAVAEGSTAVRRLAGSRRAAAPVVSIDYGHLTYTAGGRTVTLDPLGRGSYIWPSISPDGTKIAYYLSGRGCFVCDTNGRNIADLGTIRAPKWLDNNTIVGMNDSDDGEHTTASNIIAINLDGSRCALTDDALIAMYPSPSADGKHIAFSTANGELFIINLK